VAMVQTSITLDSLDLEVRLTQYLFRCGIILFLKIHFGNKNYYENLAINIYNFFVKFFRVKTSNRRRPLIHFLDYFFLQKWRQILFHQIIR